mgnify:CR=1 FL=1
MTPTSADAGGDGSVSAQANLTEALAAVLQSQWTPDAYTSYYDVGWCLNQNVSYSHRVNAEGGWAGVQRLRAPRRDATRGVRWARHTRAARTWRVGVGCGAGRHPNTYPLS